MQNQSAALVITTISGPNEAIKNYADECKKRNIPFIVIGDSATPDEYHDTACDFYSLQKQKTELAISLSKLLPDKKYSRKNIGYLLAMAKNAEVIIETDDDNFPMRKFWKFNAEKTKAYLIENGGWINVYSYFTEKEIWPRAFPLEMVQNKTPELHSLPFKEFIAPVQQGLADDNPDVDAVFRLVNVLPLKFKKNPSIALGKRTWCPFNSQNTRWYRVAFPLMYLPTYCSFRMTDIWRSFIAQRIFHENNWHILFHKATVYQKRNEHNLIKDFTEEIPGYINNSYIITELEKLNLKKGESFLCDNLLSCYYALIKMKLIEEKEMYLLHAWIHDVKTILNFQKFP